MSIILWPGDRVHLALPIKAGLDPKEFAEEAAKQYSEYQASYGAMGVQIALATSSDRIFEPRVVAVFRSNA